MLTHATHSEPSNSDRNNEDWYLATDDLVIVLDGATIRTGTGCLHGLPWFVRHFGLQLATAASENSTPLVDCIAAAIRSVSAMHADTCDLSHPGTPSAALGIVRERGEHLEYAVLGDITLAFEVNDQPHAHVVVDPRVSEVAVDARANCDRYPIGTDEKAAAMLSMKELELAARNCHGGYWIASVNPAAAEEALTGSISTDRVVRFAACSDGAMRALTMTSVQDHAGLLTVLRHMGPVELVNSVRQAEARDPQGRRWPRNKVSDDATVVFTELQRPPAQIPPTREQQERAIEGMAMFRRPVMGEQLRS